MKLTTGLNPYGLTYYLGLQGMGTPRHNPNGAGLEGFIALTEELGGKAIELWEGWFKDMSDAELSGLKDRLDKLGWKRVLSSGLLHCDMDLLLRSAKALDAKFVRLALTPILCGDRVAAGPRWDELVAEVNAKLAEYAPRAEAAGVVLLIENHQDFTSRELVAFCDKYVPRCASFSTWPIPFRWPNRRSNSPRSSRLTCAIATPRITAPSSPMTASGWSVVRPAMAACRSRKCSRSSASTMTR